MRTGGCRSLHGDRGPRVGQRRRAESAPGARPDGCHNARPITQSVHTRHVAPERVARAEDLAEVVFCALSVAPEPRTPAQHARWLTCGHGDALPQAGPNEPRTHFTRLLRRPPARHSRPCAQRPPGQARSLALAGPTHRQHALRGQDALHVILCGVAPARPGRAHEPRGAHGGGSRTARASSARR